MDYFIVRTYSAGVFAGNIETENNKEVTLKNARRLWFWDGAASLSELAEKGTSKPDNCKFPCEVSEIRLKDVIEILKCSNAGEQSIKGVKVWSAH